MSVQLPTFSLSNVAANQRGTIDLSKLNLSAAPVHPVHGPFAHLLCFNDSGVTFVLAPTSQQQKQTPIPANRVVIVDVPPGEASMTWTILSVYPYIYTPQCFLFYYLPYEPVDYDDLGAVSAGQFGNQIRVISVPLAVPSFTNQWAPTAPGNTITVVNLNMPSLTAGQIITNYCYGIEIALAGAAANASIDISLTATLEDHTSAILAGPLTLYRTVRSTPAGNTGQTGDFSPVAAMRQQFSAWAAGAGAPYQILWQLLANAVTGTPSVTFTVLVDSDVTTLATPGTIGHFIPQMGPF